MPGKSEVELELGDYIAILKRRWAWVLVPIIACGALAFVASSTQAATYNATAEVLLSDSAAQSAVDAGSQSTAFRNRILENEIRLALSDQALIGIADDLGTEPGDVPKFTVTADASSDVLLFSTNRPTADGAATVANVAAETYVRLKQEQASASITGAVANLEARLVDLQAQRQDTRSTLVELEDALNRASEGARPTAQAAVDREESRISGQLALVDAQIAATADSITQLDISGELALGGTARIVTMANPPLSSTNSSTTRNVVIGLLAGLVLGAALAVLRETLDNKVRTTQDLERLGLVPLGSIPKASRKTSKSLELALISLEDADTPQAQAHQKTQAAVRFLAGQQDIRNLLVTSASQGEGKTTLASNLAISMALSNTRTVLVDLDLRRPRIHKAYDIPQSPGITSVVVDDLDVVDAAARIDNTEDRLVVVPAGKLPPHAASFISSNGFGETVKQLSKLSDFTVFDAPPVLPVADTLTLASMVSGVVLVAYANQTRSDDLESAIESLTSGGAHILGAVLLGVKDAQTAYDYYSTDEALERL